MTAFNKEIFLDTSLINIIAQSIHQVNLGIISDYVPSKNIYLVEIAGRSSEFLVKTRFLVVSTCRSSHFTLNGEIWRDGT